METEKVVEGVSAQPVAEVATQTTSEDYQAKFADLLAKVEPVLEKVSKLETERDSYKEGMLAKDRKLKELKNQGYEIEDDEPKTDIKAAVREALQEMMPQVAEKESEVSSLKKAVSELKTALVNRAQLSSTPQGSSTEGKEVTPLKWSQEQLDYFKANNLDPNKVWDNYKAALEK